jgi:hypothetical protein
MTSNVFLVHTPFQNFMAHHMLRTLPEFRETQNVLVACLDGPRIAHDLWSRVIAISPPLSPRFSPRTMAAARLWAARVMAAAAACEEVRVFLANADLPIGNAFYQWARRGGPFRFCSLPEGVGSVFPGRFRCSKRIKLLAKRCLSTVTLQHYADYGAHYASLGTADRIYTLAPEYLQQYASRLTRIPVPEYPVSGKMADGWLVLGEAFDNFMPHEAGRRLVAELREYVLANATGRLVYSRTTMKTVFSRRCSSVLDLNCSSIRVQWKNSFWNGHTGRWWELARRPCCTSRCSCRSEFAASLSGRMFRHSTQGTRRRGTSISLMPSAAPEWR